MKTTQKFSRSQITRNAWKLVKQYKLSFSKAMKNAWAMAKKGASEFFQIKFKKKDGELTQRVGFSAGIKQTHDACLTFFDFTKGRFSRAIKQNIIQMVAVAA